MDCNTVIGEIVEAKQAKDEKLYFVIEKFFLLLGIKNQRSEKEEKEQMYL